MSQTENKLVGMTLDEIISSRRKARSAKARGHRATTRVREEVLGKAPAIIQGTKVHSEKILVSGLPVDVGKNDIRDLFNTTIGYVSAVIITYDANGKSTGNAAVSFKDHGDAQKAYGQYNNRLIDGKRPMKIELVVDPERSLPLASRVTAAKPKVERKVKGRIANNRVGVRDAGRKRKVGGRKQNDRQVKTAADLDAEMADYTAGAAPTPVA